MIEDLADSLVKEIERAVVNYAHDTEYAMRKHLRKLVMDAMRATVIFAVGLTFVSAGAVFLAVSSVLFLSSRLSMWAAAGVVGAAFLGAGTAGLLVLRSRILQPHRASRNRIER